MTRPLSGSDRVLVRLPSWLGDLVQAEPALRALAARVEPPLSLAAPEPLLAVLEGLHPRAVRIAHRGRGGEEPAAWRGHDVAILFTGSFRSAWTAWRAGIQRRVGWARDGRAPLLTEGPRPPLERGGTPLGIGKRGGGRRFLPRPFGASCVELVGSVGVEVADTRPYLPVSEAWREAATQRLAEAGLEPGAPYVLVNTGARPGSAKGYPSGSWAEALDLLSARVDLPIVLTCGPGEEEGTKEVRRAAARARPVALIDPVVGLGELAALCAGARVFLTADTGPRHVAMAVGARVVCVLGPTDPRHSADHLRGVRLVRRPVPCGPCHLERCPLAGEAHHACMHGIDPRELVDRTLERVE